MSDPAVQHTTSSLSQLLPAGCREHTPIPNVVQARHCFRHTSRCAPPVPASRLAAVQRARPRAVGPRSRAARPPSGRSRAAGLLPVRGCWREVKRPGARSLPRRRRRRRKVRMLRTLRRRRRRRSRLPVRHASEVCRRASAACMLLGTAALQLPPGCCRAAARIGASSVLWRQACYCSAKLASHCCCVAMPCSTQEQRQRQRQGQGIGGTSPCFHHRGRLPALPVSACCAAPC